MNVNFWFWFRAVAMCLGLVGTITAIRNLNQFKEPEVPPGSVNLCTTRITVISTPDGMRVSQEGLTWFRKTADRLEELDPIAVEKWFGRHCVVDAEPAKIDKDAKVAALISFVSGLQTPLVSANGVYRWNGHEFTSAELTEALKTLADLPLRLRPSR